MVKLIPIELQARKIIEEDETLSAWKVRVEFQRVCWFPHLFLLKDCPSSTTVHLLAAKFVEQVLLGCS